MFQTFAAVIAVSLDTLMGGTALYLSAEAYMHGVSALSSMYG